MATKRRDEDYPHPGARGKSAEAERSLGAVVWVQNLEADGTIVRSSEIEGMTFLGGEPFDQAPALAELGARLRRCGLSVMTFTGYLFEDIRDFPRDGWSELLAVTDLLVDGPYVAAHSDATEDRSSLQPEDRP